MTSVTPSTVTMAIRYYTVAGQTAQPIWLEIVDGVARMTVLPCPPRPELTAVAQERTKPPSSRKG